ncbi:MAG: phospholipase D-like domain-containing protein [Herbaspirillum sp.]
MAAILTWSRHYEVKRPCKLGASMYGPGARIPMCTIGAYTIRHDRYINVDGKTVHAGSFNYSKLAATKNSENVLMILDNPCFPSNTCGIAV